MKKFLLIYLILFSSLTALADKSFNSNGWVEPLANLEQEKRARILGREIKCVICGGQSIEDSRADMAIDMRRFIRLQIADGKSDKEVIQIMRENYKDKYGDSLFMMPPFKLRTLFLWLAPIILLLLGGWIMYSSTFRKNHSIENQKKGK